ncbi:3'-5' exonuclease, partial [Salinivibrio proteolyticus]|uniref:3'-5' exonuclease n=1 Tax=Salinivibrio proteolyticus TaxID=334715 RepID=UPI0023ED718A
SQRIIDHYIKYQDEGYAVKSKSDIHDFPSVVHVENEIHKSDLPEYIKSIVEHHLSQGIPESEIVILCPSWFDVIGASNKLNDLDKDFNIDGFLISPIPKNQDNIWLTLIRLALTKPDIKNYLKRRRYSSELSERINTITQDDELTSPKKILKTINSICVESDDEIENWIENIIKKFCEKLNISLDAETVAYREKESLKNSTSERIKKYKMNYRASDLESFFSSASGVKITTSHSTKGDEYEVVICTGLLHGKIPHWNDIRNQTSQHQNYVARRLLYVICSRAKKHLYLISERGHQTGGGCSYTPTRQL